MTIYLSQVIVIHLLLDPQVTLVPKVIRVALTPPELQEIRVIVDIQGLLDPLDLKEIEDTQVLLDTLALKDLWAV